VRRFEGISFTYLFCGALHILFANCLLTSISLVMEQQTLISADNTHIDCSKQHD